MNWQILQGDARQIPLADASVHCVVTSPPFYGLRDYGVVGQIGLEPTIQDYLNEMLAVFKEVWRVLRPEGTCWVEIGDTYAGNRGYQVPDNKHKEVGNSKGMKVPQGLKAKDLCGVPWRLAFALQDMGWYLRSDIIWRRPNPMPESVSDRPTKSHSYVFLLTKQERYYYDAEAIRESQVVDSQEAALKRAGTYGTGYDRWVDSKGFRGDGGLGQNRKFNPLGRNARSVWTIATEPTSFAHFATMPTALAERCIKAGCPKGGIVFDPFSGAGTTVLVADRLGRHGIGLELSRQYCLLAKERLSKETPLFVSVEPKAPQITQEALW